MNRRGINAWMLASAAGFGTSGAIAQPFSGRLVDDGTMDLKPAFNFVYRTGSPTAFARAFFENGDTEATVRVGPYASIKANGIALEEDFLRGGGTRYIKDIPFIPPDLVFEWARPKSPPIRYAFVVPEITAIELPMSYRTPQRLKVRLAAPLPEKDSAVVQEVTALNILTSAIRVDFVLQKVEDSGTLLTFDPLIRMEQPPGRFPATIIQHQRHALRLKPGPLSKGWLTCNTEIRFDIDVLG